MGDLCVIRSPYIIMTQILIFVLQSLLLLFHTMISNTWLECIFTGLSVCSYNFTTHWIGHEVYLIQDIIHSVKIWNRRRNGISQTRININPGISHKQFGEGSFILIKEVSDSKLCLSKKAELNQEYNVMCVCVCVCVCVCGYFGCACVV